MNREAKTQTLLASMETSVKKLSTKVTISLEKLSFIQKDAVEDEEGVDAIHDNIDIARDYLLYSAQKSSEDQKSFSQYDNSVYQHEDNYTQVFFCSSTHVIYKKLEQIL